MLLRSICDRPGQTTHFVRGSDSRRPIRRQFQFAVQLSGASIKQFASSIPSASFITTTSCCQSPNQMLSCQDRLVLMKCQEGSPFEPDLILESCISTITWGRAECFPLVQCRHSSSAYHCLQGTRARGGLCGLFSTQPSNRGGEH